MGDRCTPRLNRYLWDCLTLLSIPELQFVISLWFFWHFVYLKYNGLCPIFILPGNITSIHTTFCSFSQFSSFTLLFYLWLWFITFLCKRVEIIVVVEVLFDSLFFLWIFLHCFFQSDKIRSLLSFFLLLNYLHLWLYINLLLLIFFDCKRQRINHSLVHWFLNDSTIWICVWYVHRIADYNNNE